MNVRVFQHLHRLTTAAVGTGLLCCAAQGATLSGGTTTVDFDASFVQTLVGAKFGVAPVSPATLNLASTPATATFPITGGSTTGMIDHSGGLTFTLGSTSATVENFVINVPTSVLSGEVTVGSTTLMNVPLFDISSNLTLTVDPTLGAALASDFSIPNLSGATVGTAMISPVTTATPEPASAGLIGLGIAAFGFAMARARKS